MLFDAIVSIKKNKILRNKRRNTSNNLFLDFKELEKNKLGSIIRR
jgi:hypothetical protein